MSFNTKSIQTTDATSFSYIFEKNASVPLRTGGVIRCNVYRPKGPDGQRYPVLATYGPYGKDVHYSNFHPASYADVNPKHKTEHSAWEVPTPEYWTKHGYAVVRADEVGTGQSPGFLNALSTATIDSFYDLIEWASDQPWSTGKVGLLGISYFGSTQWQVAARRPKGLAAIIPWEGFTDFYRDATRHGGILSSGGITAIWNRQIGSNQYGLPGRADRNWGDDTVEGSLTEDQLASLRTTFIAETRTKRFRDDSRYASVNYNLEDIQVPLLSVANWGGFLLHLRGNVQGYTNAGSELKYLRFIVGRHDLPFFYDEEVELQRSFLDAFLQGNDPSGWTRKGEIPPVSLILRKGNVGYNNPEGEKQFVRREEMEWPLARTQYNKMFLQPSGSLDWKAPDSTLVSSIQYLASDEGEKSSRSVTFTTEPMTSELEVTGHIVVHLNVATQTDGKGCTPSDMDLFVNIRHITASGDEVFYTGTTGEAAPVSKGFLRVSMRKTNPDHPRHRTWLPHRDYLSTDALPVIPGDVYGVDIEVMPTNVVLQKGERLVLEVGSCDLSGTGFFTHDDPEDRPDTVFKGLNKVYFGPMYSNYITLPVIPQQ